MFPFRRPTGLPGRLPRLHGPVLALLLAAGAALPCAYATSASTKASGPPRVGAGAGAGASTPAAVGGSNLAKSEVADIADLRRRLVAKSVVLTRHAEVDDIAIQVWARTTTPKKFYVAVTQQGTVRRTLTANDEAEAWRSYDSFRRMAGLGEVGRPVLLGQQMPAVTAIAAAPAVPTPGTRAPVAMLSAMPAAPGAPITPIAPSDLEAAARTPPPRLDAPMAAREISASTGESIDPRLAGYGVETLRRARVGDEVARLVWSAESRQYFVALTRQGSVVALLRSRDAAEATRTYEDYVRQAETRATLLPGRSAGATSSASR